MMNGYVCACIGDAVYEKQVNQYQTMLRGKRTVKLSLPHDEFRRLKTMEDASKMQSQLPENASTGFVALQRLKTTFKSMYHGPTGRWARCKGDSAL